MTLAVIFALNKLRQKTDFFIKINSLNLNIQYESTIWKYYLFKEQNLFKIIKYWRSAWFFSFY